MNLARSKGILEFHDVPEGNLERLKNASMGKKRTAVENLSLKSGSPENLIYLDSRDPVFGDILGLLA
jgi:coenzyme F420 hydrogenase subunit beta